MNQHALSFKNYLLALGTVGALVAGAVASSALFAHASSGPAVTTKTTNANNAVVTSAPIGTAVVENASVASSTATTTTPGGTVTFSTFNNLTCSGTSTVQSGVALLNGAASSSQVTMTQSGLSYLVNYNGDATNTPSVSSCTAVTPTSAVVTVTNALSATSVVAGSPVTAQATLGGNTANASGTVAYNVYTNNACTLATTSPASVAVTNGVAPASAALTFSQPGTYYFQAVYSGDANNGAAISACGPALTVFASSTPGSIFGGDKDGDRDGRKTQTATSTSVGHEGAGEGGFKIHLPDLNADFHAFLGSFNGKHKGEDKIKVTASTTLQVQGEGHGNNHANGNDQDDN